MRRPPPLVLAAAASILAAMPTPALAGPADVAATRAYIQADYTLVHTARINLATSEAALQRLRRRIEAECPQAAAGSPEDTDSEQLSGELLGAMTVAAIDPDAQAVATFTRTVRRLHWSNATLTRKVKSYATRLTTLSVLPAPDVCSDVRAWVASDYQTLPASAVSFDSRYYKVEVTIGEVPARLLTPSEQPNERPVLAHAERLETQLTEAEARAAYTLDRIMEALGLDS